MLLIARIAGQCLNPAALHHVDPFGWFGTLTDHPEGTHRVVDRLGVTKTLVLTDVQGLVDRTLQETYSHHPSGLRRRTQLISKPGLHRHDLFQLTRHGALFSDVAT